MRRDPTALRRGLPTEPYVVPSVFRTFPFQARPLDHVSTVLDTPPLDDPVQFGNVITEGSPNLLVVNAVVGMVDHDSHPPDLGPGQLARSGNKLGRGGRRPRRC